MPRYEVSEGTSGKFWEINLTAMSATMLGVRSDGLYVNREENGTTATPRVSWTLVNRSLPRPSRIVRQR